MASKTLYIWVEGSTDRSLFERMKKRLFMKKYRSVKFIQYANMTKKKRINFLNSIKAMKDDNKKGI